MTERFEFLPLSDRKGLPTPRVIYRDLDDCGGFYAARTSERCIDEWLGIDRREQDVIVLSTHWGDVPGSVVAHEHRHFQQHYLLGLPRLGYPQASHHDGTFDGWMVAVGKFYLCQPWEMDALKYSARRQLDESVEQQFAAVRSVL